MPIERLELMTDENLASLSAKNNEAFALLIKRYEGRLLAYAHRLSGCRNEDAEDIVQESFIKAYYNINDFDPKLKFSSWIYRIVHNETISEWRKRKARPSVVLDNESWSKISVDQDLSKDLDDKINREKFEELINQLPLKYREVIMLKFIEERTYEEIADILKKPSATIGTLINRAKKQLQVIYKYGKFK